MLVAVTQIQEPPRGARWWGLVVLIIAAFAAMGEPAWCQAVSGIRGVGGGVAALHDLAGPEAILYFDGQGTQGFLNKAGTFESYNFRASDGTAWKGSMMTMGPQLTIGLISGANQAAFNPRTGTSQLSFSPTVMPPLPRELPPLPPIQSSILEEFSPLVDIP